jgi:3-hydroxybutyryl-CoA dehydrogenase
VSDLVVGVVGAGTMGSGIAQVAAAAGHRVVLADAAPGAARSAHERLARTLATLADKGKFTHEESSAIVARIAVVEEPLGSDVGAYRDCGLVIEAIVEDLAIKQRLFAALEGVVSRDAVLASNTSSLSITALAGACTGRERVIGVHFFNPAPLLPLVEIVPWAGTATGITDRTRALVSAWGKTTVVAADTPGFIVNRVARPFYTESLRILDEGIADCATIDWALQDAGGFRMGPFELMDLIGNDVNLAVTRTLFAASYWEPRYRPSLTQERLVEAGYLGRKSGRGYYDHSPDAQRPQPVRDAALGARIFDRVLAMLINEAADAVFYRVASPADVDLAMLKGVNYPRGLLGWSDSLGAQWTCDRLEELRDVYGEERYRTSPLLRRLAHERRGFFV